jgi:NitT/TauT family transport system ATP-binding protein
MDSISVEKLGFQYESGLKVFEDLSFSARENEFLSIVGPSGCGKTTLLLLLSGLYRASAGTVLIDGARVTRPLRKVGLVFQEYNRALLPWRSIVENVELGLELQGTEPKERRDVAKKYIDLVGLSKFADDLPGRLSGGMKQRVQIARILAYNPSILLMDEPFGALDAQTRLELHDELLRIFEIEKKTVVFVTHDIEEAVYLGDRLLILSQRPSRLLESLDISIPRPRAWEIRGSSNFVGLCTHTWDMMKKERLASSWRP